jgi:hypothetical protein
VSKRFEFRVTAKLPNDAAEWDFGVRSDDFDYGLDAFKKGLACLDEERPNDQTVTTPR